MAAGFGGILPAWSAAKTADNFPMPLVAAGEFTMRESRVGAAVVAKGDYLYIIGGSNGREAAPSVAGSLRPRRGGAAALHVGVATLGGATASPSVERLDLRTGKSEPFATLQRARIGHRAVVDGDRAYVIGGHSPTVGEEPFEKTVEVINLVTGEVTGGVADLPDPRMNFGCVQLNGRIYVIGGMRKAGLDLASTNTVQVLDLATGQWAEGPPMPTPRQCEAAVVEGGYIVAAGGFNGKRMQDAVEVLDPRNIAWSKLPPLCRDTSAHSMVFLGRHLLLFGDYRETGSMIAFDLFTKKSKVFTIAPTIARHTAAVAHQNRIYVIGGRQSGDTRALDRVHVFELAPPAAE